MTDLKTIRRHLYDLAPEKVGRVESVASLTTTSVTVTALATGGYGAEHFHRNWLLRAEAASAADRVRKCTGFTSSSGALAHAGTNYSDTTATSEFVEILTPDYEPHILDREINHVLGITNRMDRTILVGRGERFYLHALDWITSPADIDRVAFVSCPVLTRNRDFEGWNAYSSAGALTPDWWTLAGSGATMARSTTGARKGKYTVALTRATNNVTLSQSVGLLHDGSTATPNSLAGQVVSAVLVGTASSANQLRITIDDGADTTSSSYHSGGGAIEELTVERTLDADATKCDIEIEVNGTDGTVYVDEAYGLFGQVTDTVRRDDYVSRERTLPTRDMVFDQISNALILPRIGWGQQYVVYSKRPYPRLDTTRVSGGSADSDTVDAPKEIIAVGTLWRIHEALADRVQGASETDQARKAYLMAEATRWRRRYEDLAESHLAVRQDHDGGIPLPVGPLGGPGPGRA